MAVKLVVLQAKRFIGLSADAKPAFDDDTNRRPLAPGAEFYETDTRRTFRWDGSAWQLLAAGAYGADSTGPDRLLEILEIMTQVLDECRATRLGIQAWLDAGDPTSTDLLEQAESIRDQTLQEI